MRRGTKKRYTVFRTHQEEICQAEALANQEEADVIQLDCTNDQFIVHFELVLVRFRAWYHCVLLRCIVYIHTVLDAIHSFLTLNLHNKVR